MRPFVLFVVVALLAGCATPGPSSSPSASTPNASTPATPSTVATTTTTTGPTTPAPTASGPNAGASSPTAGSADVIEDWGVAADALASAPVTPFGQDNAPWITLGVPAGTQVISPIDGKIAGLESSAINLTPPDASFVVILIGVDVSGPLALGTAVHRGDVIGASHAGGLRLAVVDPTASQALCPADKASPAAVAAIGGLDAACKYEETAWRMDAGGGYVAQGPYERDAAVVAALPACNATPFTTPPMATADTLAIMPLGNLNPPEHTIPSDHVYFMYQRIATTSATQSFRVAPVVAPGDITIYQVTEQLANRSGSLNDDYAIYFSPCHDVKAWFGHVSTIEGGLQAAFANATSQEGACRDYGDPVTNSTFHQCDAHLAYRAAAGEQIGTGGGKASAALDMGARDARANASSSVADPARFGGDELQIVCPVDLFTDPPRAALQALLGSDRDHPRTVEPRCGSAFADAVGTVQGAWFAPDLPSDSGLGPDAWHKSLEFAYEPTDGITGVLSLGGPLPSDRVTFTPTHSGNVDRAFADVTPSSGVVCYQGATREGTSHAYLVDVVDGTHLSIEPHGTTCGSGPWTLSSPTAFVR